MVNDCRRMYFDSDVCENFSSAIKANRMILRTDEDTDCVFLSSKSEADN